MKGKTKWTVRASKGSGWYPPVEGGSERNSISLARDTVKTSPNTTVRIYKDGPRHL